MAYHLIDDGGFENSGVQAPTGTASRLCVNCWILFSNLGWTIEHYIKLH